jgi:hypothetical protein
VGEERFLRRLGLTTAVLAAACHAAAAAVTGHDTLFTTVCIDDQVSGFDWHDGAWLPGMFYPNKYTLQKRDTAGEECADAMKAAPPANALFSDVTAGCYTITDFGMAPGPPVACSEMWEAAPDGSETLANVTCASLATFEWIIFDPSGNYQYAQVGGNLSDKPRDDMKDALVVSVGKCKLGRAPGLYPPGN